MQYFQLSKWSVANSNFSFQFSKPILSFETFVTQDKQHNYGIQFLPAQAV